MENSKGTMFCFQQKHSPQISFNSPKTLLYTIPENHLISQYLLGKTVLCIATQMHLKI